MTARCHECWNLQPYCTCTPPPPPTAFAHLVGGPADQKRLPIPMPPPPAVSGNLPGQWLALGPQFDYLLSGPTVEPDVFVYRWIEEDQLC